MSERAESEPAPRAPRSRRSFSFGQVVFGLMLVTAAVLLVGVPYYLKHVRYERVAALHLPADTELAVRADFEHIILFEPARRNLIPLANELLPPKSPQATPRLTRLEKRTGLSLVRDVREVVVARGSEAGQWLVLLGGKFPPGVVAALGEILREEGQAWEGDGAVITRPGGVSIGQADDGVLVFGPSRERVLAALGRTDVQERMGLSLRGAVAVAARGRSLEQLTTRLASRSADFARIGRLERVTGELMLAEVPKGQLVLRLPPGTSVSSAETALAAAVRGFAAQAAAGPERAGEAALLRAATVSSPATGILEVSFPWRQEGLEQGAESLAAWMRTVASSG